MDRFKIRVGSYGFFAVLAVAWLSVTWLVADLVHAQDKTRRAERRARRSQQSTGGNTDRDTGADTSNDGSAGQSETESPKSDDEQSTLTLRDVINFAAESRD